MSEWTKVHVTNLPDPDDARSNKPILVVIDYFSAPYLAYFKNGEWISACDKNIVITGVIKWMYVPDADCYDD